MVFSQLLINGLIAGAIYALVASGFALIYATNRFVHFAHGAVVASGAYILYTFYNLLGVNFYLACVGAITGAAFLGFLCYVLLYGPLRKRKSSSVILLMASIGLMTLLQNLLVLFFGTDAKIIGFIKAAEGMDVLGARITPVQVLIFVAAFILFVVLWLFMNKTKFGRILRAVSDNPDLGKITGINTEKIHLWSFIIGSALAGFAAIFTALEQNVEPVMGVNLSVVGFTASVIGGIGSIPGAILGGFLLALSENFAIWFIPSGFKTAIGFILLLFFLLFRPSGILGVSKGTRQ